MGRLFGISILTSLFAILNGHALVGELRDREKSVESALNFMKIGLEEFSEVIERIVIKRLEGVENIVDEKKKQMIGNATRNIIEEQSTDQKKTRKNLLSTFQTEQRQKVESPTRYVDKKICDLLFSTQIEQRLFRQELISVTASLFGKLEKISDVLSKTQTEQHISNQDIKSFSTNLSEIVDQKISDLITTTQTEQQHLRQQIEFLIEEKISDVLLTTQTEQRLLSQKIEFFTTNLTGNVEEKIINVLSRTRTEQQDLDQKTEALLANYSEKVNKNIGHQLSSIQTEQQLLQLKMLSLTANLVEKVDDLRNTSIYVAEQLFSGEAINMLRNVEEISQSLLLYIVGFDCADVLEKNPYTRGKNGVYNVIDSSYKSKAVYCDMTTDNGGWTVIQRRVNGSVDFYRNWTEYKNGFGFADHEYWLGNDMLHKLTSLKTQELRVDMERFNGEKAYAVYSRFSVGDETSKYKLEVQGYSGNADVGLYLIPGFRGNNQMKIMNSLWTPGAPSSPNMKAQIWESEWDSLDYHNNMKFTTLDQDNDRWSSGNCATDRRPAWWFNSCHHANPNGEYADSEKTGGEYITWKHWKNYISLKLIQLMIRPRA